MKRLFMTALIAMLIILASCKAEKNGISVDLYKSPTCGCCGVYTSYLEQKGFEVKSITTNNIDSIKKEVGVPTELESCHTSKIEKYFVEGHVPVEVINKLLQEKPYIKGIGMAGMPSGSPGMPGSKNGPFIIYAVHNDGTTSEFVRV